jgi:hypothetical protein
MEFIFKESIIPKKGIRLEMRRQGKKVRKTGFREKESPMDLSSSGES